MASSLDSASSGRDRSTASTATTRAKENLPGLTGARQAGPPGGARPTQRRRLQNFMRSSEVRTCLLFLPPALLLFTLFVTWPVVEAAYYSFFNWNGYGAPSKWVGLDNFIRVWNDPIFLPFFI